MPSKHSTLVSLTSEHDEILKKTAKSIIVQSQA